MKLKSQKTEVLILKGGGLSTPPFNADADTPQKGRA
jgi:hypothetical protein